MKVESPSCDFLDTDEVITDGTHEVPAFITVIQDSSSGSDLSLDCHIGFQEEHAAPSDSFTACFKGKAAQAQAHGDLSDNTDQFLVPDTLDNCLDSGDDLCCNMDGVVGLVGDPNFPGDIPGLDGFEDFGSRGLTDDCGLSFDLALRGGSEAFDGDGCDTSEAGGLSLLIVIPVLASSLSSVQCRFDVKMCFEESGEFLHCRHILDDNRLEMSQFNTTGDSLYLWERNHWFHKDLRLQYIDLITKMWVGHVQVFLRVIMALV